ncbi:MAG: tetratricopeptide repeat protein [Zavarzinia sp.]|nr:tetratricopeptide repeat protein [Zavarzinia sp.]
MPSAATPETAARPVEAIELHSLSGAYLAARYAGGVQDSTASALFYDGALRLDPGNTMLRRQAMMSSLLVGDYVDAASHAEVIARLEPSDTVAPLVAAIGEMRVGRYAEARKRLDGLTSNAALDIIGPIMTAWAIAGTGDTDGALRALEKLGDAPGVRPFRLYHTALLAAFGNQPALAAKAFEALRTSPAGNWVHTLLAEGVFLESSGHQDAARALYQAALKASNNLAVAAALARLERGEAATPVVSTAVEGVAEAMYGIASLLAQSGANEPVLVYLRLATMAKPNFPEAQALLAETFEDIGDEDAAMAMFRSIPEGSELRPMAEVRYAMLLSQADRADEALDLLDRSGTAGGPSIEAMVARGDILREREDFAAAADAYGAAIDAVGEPDPRYWSLWFSRGICRERLHQWQDAEADLMQALALRPDQPSVLNYLAYSWVEQGRNLKRAEAMLLKAVADRPDDGYIVDSLGWVYFRQARFAEAVDTLEKAVHLKPGDPTVNDHLGDAYWAVGRRLEAEFQWRTALALKPEDDQKADLETKLEKGLAPEKLVPGAD